MDLVLRHPDVAALVGTFSLAVITRLARRALADVRRHATAVGEAGGDEGARRNRFLGEVVTATLSHAEAVGSGGPRRVINATGVVLHTNLGRAPLAVDAAEAVAQIARGFADIELDLNSGERGSRHAHLSHPLLDALDVSHPSLDVSGLDAVVVNNCAGAILLVLAELAHGREVIVSRGHLVEIGGGFRVPDVMRQSGARLVEVGTTNRTRLTDYADAITSETAVILSVHPSNFRIVGFSESVTMTELAALGRARGVPVVDDIGSGCLLDTSAFGIVGPMREPRPTESLAAGASVVTFSGDKLLGGPQAGIIVGHADLVARIRRHPLSRALRLDKMGMVALVATLAHYRRGRATDAIPVWQMIGATSPTLAARATAWAAALGASGVACHVTDGVSAIGGGSMPGVTLPTSLLRINGPCSPDELARRLRLASAPRVPMVGRIDENAVLLDPRTVMPVDDELVQTGVRAALGSL